MYDKEVKIIADWENEINMQENDQHKKKYF